MIFIVCLGFYAYTYWKIIRAFSGRVALKTTLAFVALACLLMPIAAMWLEGRGYYAIAWPLATIGFLLLAGAGWFFVLAIISDVWNLLARLVGLRWPRARRLIAPPGWSVIAITIVVIIGLSVGVYQAYHVQAHEVVVPVSHLPDGRKTLSVAQVSDLHLGINERGPRMRQVLDILRDTKPDLILFTGDIIDSPLPHVREFAPQFAQLHAPLGKFASMGNHEFYVARDSSIEGVLDWYHQAGFTVLRQQNIRLGQGLLLAGIDDGGHGPFDTMNLSDESVALHGVQKDDVVLFLKHRPLTDDYWCGQTMIQFSGHAHGGQIWPWHYISMTQFPRLRGLFELAPGRYLNVSTGAGTWGPQVRLFAPPEVTILKLQVE